MEYRELRLAYLQGELGAPDAPNRAGMLFDAFWRGYFGEEREQQKRDEMIAFAAGRDSAAKEHAREDWAEDGIRGVPVTDYQRRIYNAVPKDKLADPGQIAQKLGIDARRCGAALVMLAEKGLLARRERASGDWGYRQK